MPSFIYSETCFTVVLPDFPLFCFFLSLSLSLSLLLIFFLFFFESYLFLYMSSFLSLSMSSLFAQLTTILSMGYCMDRRKCTRRELRTGAFFAWPMLYGWVYPNLMMVGTPMRIRIRISANIPYGWNLAPNNFP